MDKVAVGPEAVGVVTLDAPVAARISAVAKAMGKRVENVTVMVLDRPRHQQLVAEVRAAGAHVRFIPDGDVAAAVLAASPGSGVDMLMGVGGTPEGVIAAAALTCLGGELLGRLAPMSDLETDRARAAGLVLDKVLTTSDLVGSDDVYFCATGITNGDLLKGVRYWGDGASTQSLVMRSKSGTIRTIESTHKWEKLMRYSAFKFD